MRASSLSSWFTRSESSTIRSASLDLEAPSTGSVMAGADPRSVRLAPGDLDPEPRPDPAPSGCFERRDRRRRRNAHKADDEVAHHAPVKHDLPANLDSGESPSMTAMERP